MSDHCAVHPKLIYKIILNVNCNGKIKLKKLKRDVEDVEMLKTT